MRKPQRFSGSRRRPTNLNAPNVALDLVARLSGPNPVTKTNANFCRWAASDADAAVVDSLKALDLKRPIREADISGSGLLQHAHLRGFGTKRHIAQDGKLWKSRMLAHLGDYEHLAKRLQGIASR